MAMIHREKREIAKGVASAQRATELDPNYVGAYVMLASMLCYRRRVDRRLGFVTRLVDFLSAQTSALTSVTSVGLHGILLQRRFY